MSGLAVFVAFVSAGCSGGDAPGRPEPDGQATVGKLGDLNSYEYEVRFLGAGSPLADLTRSLLPFLHAPGTSAPETVISFEIVGAFVKPDRGFQTIQLGSTKIAFTVLGAHRWTAIYTAGVPFVTGPEPRAVTLSELSFAAALWDDNVSKVIVSSACAEIQIVNGVEARRCEVSAPTDALADFFVPLGDGKGVRSFDELEVIAWLAVIDNYPVEVSLFMRGKDSNGDDFHSLVRFGGHKRQQPSDRDLSTRVATARTVRGATIGR